MVDPIPVSDGSVAEAFVFVVVVERVHLLIDVGDEEIGPAVLVVVRGIDAHAGPGAAVGAVAYARDQADFLEFPLAD